MQASFEQPWKESLCDCLDDRRICCYGCWCWCCLYGQNAAQIEDRGSLCLMHCCSYAVLNLLCCCCLIHTIQRGRLRHKYGLDEGSWGDFLTTCVCAQCAICQEARELKVRGNLPRLPTIVVQQPQSATSGIPYTIPE